MGGYVRAMRRYGVFHGRAARAEFWQFAVVAVALAFLALVADAAIADLRGIRAQDPAQVVTALVVVIHLLPAFTVTVRRLHDVEHSGWLVLLNYLPPLNLIIVAFACMRGTRGPNRYGPDPLAAEGASAGTAQTTTGDVAIAARATGGPGRAEVIAELERLGRLRREGHLNEAEFAVMKSEALAQGQR